MENKIYMSQENWLNLGKKIYGENLLNYKFKCPSCGRIASGEEYKNAGAKPKDMCQCCISRFLKDSDCRWAAFGLFDICKIRVITPKGEEIPVFEYAGLSEEDYISAGGNYEKGL